jgi:thiol-disulfide isomerase/thioredoxin
MKNRIKSRVWGVAIGCGILLGLAGASLWWDGDASAEPSDYQGDLLGTQAPEWEVEHWMHSDPVHLKDLRGKVVLVRWWTGPGCPYCTASAPALNEFYRKYHDQGLEVFGFYHHKARRPLSVPWVKQYAEQELRFEFPVAIDPQWNTLREWWLAHGGRRWTRP